MNHHDSSFTILNSLLDAGSFGDDVINEDDLAAAGVVGGGEQHSVALHARETRGSEIGDDNNLFADKLLGRVVMLDARNDHALLQSVRERELQAVGGLAYLLRLENFTYSQIDL